MTKRHGLSPALGVASHLCHLLPLLFLVHVSSGATPTVVSQVFTRTGGDVTATCRPEDGVEMAREVLSGRLQCCASCLRVESCEVAAFSDQQGLCLLYDQPWGSGQCAVQGDWTAWGKGGASNRTVSS